MGVHNLLQRRSKAALKGQILRAQGWPRFLRPTLGRDSMMRSTLKGLRPYSILAGLTGDGIRYPGLSGIMRRSTLGFEKMPFQGINGWHINKVSGQVFPNFLRVSTTIHNNLSIRGFLWVSTIIFV